MPTGMTVPPRDLTGDQARVLIDEILARTVEDFILHFSWKKVDATPGGASRLPVRIEGHLSFHGTWSAEEILATSKGRNEQIEEIILRSLRSGGQGGGAKRAE